MGNIPAGIINALDTISSELESMTVDEKVNAINFIKTRIHQISPMKGEPVDCVLWVKAGDVKSNDYNPNVVAPPEMTLLKKSIESDGYTQPIVTYDLETHREVVDGFHRSRVGKEVKTIRQRTNGYLPVTTIRSDRTDRDNRIASTIRHNRARGRHAVDNMSEIVVELSRRNWSNSKIASELGMDADEVLRLKQISGLAELFADKTFSEAWELD